MRNRTSAQRGFKLVSLLTAHGCACVVCCLAFPHVVGPIVPSNEYLPPHDPTCVLQSAISPNGSEAFVEISRPHGGLPGSLDVAVINRTDKPMYNVTVRYPLREQINVSLRGLSRQFTVSPTEVQAHFDVLEPHLQYDQALDFRYPQSRGTVPIMAGFLAP